jgi:hypothetical protein
MLRKRRRAVRWLNLSTVLRFHCPRSPQARICIHLTDRSQCRPDNLRVDRPPFSVQRRRQPARWCRCAHLRHVYEHDCCSGCARRFLGYRTRFADVELHISAPCARGNNFASRKRGGSSWKELGATEGSHAQEGRRCRLLYVRAWQGEG